MGGGAVSNLLAGVSAEGCEPESTQWLEGVPRVSRRSENFTAGQDEDIALSVEQGQVCNPSWPPRS